MKPLTLALFALLTFGTLNTATYADPVTIAVRPAPAIAPGVWVSGTPTTIASLRGKVVVLLFWTHECINCKHNLPYWNDWAKRYKNSDVAVLSVHTPELASERVIDNVRRAVREHGLVFPVVTDNASATWNAYGIRSWPSEVLIDKAGRIRALYEGELNWNGSGEFRAVEHRIDSLRSETIARR